MDRRSWCRVREGRGGAKALIVAFWLLVGPPDRGDQPVWVIQGGYENRASCEASRWWRPNPHWLLCVDTVEDLLRPGSRPPTAASLP